MSLEGELTELLYRHDPVGLAATGAPKDEYKPEVQAILPRLCAARNVADVQRIVYDEFLRLFASEQTCGPAAGFTAIAQEIWERFLTD
jgi:hypothetical protein